MAIRKEPLPETLTGWIPAAVDSAVDGVVGYSPRLPPSFPHAGPEKLTIPPTQAPPAMGTSSAAAHPGGRQRGRSPGTVSPCCRAGSGPRRSRGEGSLGVQPWQPFSRTAAFGGPLPARFGAGAGPVVRASVRSAAWGSKPSRRNPAAVQLKLG